MKFTDRDLSMLFGELDENEVQGALSSMSGESKASFLELKATLGELKSLRDDVPQLQLSPERLKDAITNAPRKAAAPWCFGRWAFGGLATAACALAFLFVMNNRSSGPATDSSSMVAGVETHGKTTQPATTQGAPSPEPRGPSVVAKSDPEPEVVSPVVTVRTEAPKPKIRRAPRSRYHNSVAKLDRQRDSLKSGASAPTVKSTEGGAPAAFAAGGAGRGTMADVNPELTADVSNESVVVVTSDLDANSGANHAVEVSVRNDVVLGS